MEVQRLLMSIMFMTDPKKKNLVFIGQSDSGKSKLSQVLCLPYREYEVRSITMPAGNNVPEFWLADITNASARKYEELCIANSILAQALKGLFEGNPNTKCNRKYRAYVKTTESLLIVTMNDDCKEDMCEYVSNELPAFINRTKVLFFSRGMPAACKKYLPMMLR